MMNEKKQKLTLDRSVNYQIIVPGHLDSAWSYWEEKITITIDNDEDGLPITTLTGTIDQAAIQGLLRRLYSLGLPLISVNCIE